MTVSINGTNGLVFNDASTQNTAATGFGFKNRIINGAMVIDQRNNGASVTPANGAYTLDRYIVIAYQASKFTVQQNAGAVTPPVGFVNYLGVTSSSAYTVGAGEYFMVGQRIEGNNLSDMAWGTANAATATLSFRVYSSLTGTFGGSLINGAANRSYPFSFTVSSANTWTTISITIAGDTSGTWAATTGTGAQVCFNLGAGSTFSGTANTWQAGQIQAPTGSVSVVGTSGATFYITGVQLEKGSTATSFDYRPYGTELALCQRYYQRIAGTDTSFAPALRWTASTIGFTVSTPVSLRGSPAITSSGTFVIIGNGLQETFTSPSLGSWSSSAVTLLKSGLTNNPATTSTYGVAIPGASTNYVDFSSEL